MNDLLRRLRLQRIDGRSDHEAMRDAAAAIEVLEERVFQMDALRARVAELEAERASLLEAAQKSRERAARLELKHGRLTTGGPDV